MTKKNIEKEESEEKVVSKASKDFCSQINQLLKIANDKNFKSIEGNETNTTKKINDSKFKLKGAKTTKTKKILKKDCNKFSSKNTFEITKTVTEIATVIP